MPRFYLNSYRPLVSTAHGRRASAQHDIPPFVDGSIRREPDFEHQFPSITCICRAGKFAPRLCVGDFVAYMTLKGRYGNDRGRHRRLTAVLKVIHVAESHQAAANWYGARGLPLPSNCIVPGNRPKPLNQSVGKRGCTNQRGCGVWDQHYQQRVAQHPRFVICEPLWVRLDADAPRIDEAALIPVFGCVPATRNPGSHDLDRLILLLRHLKLPTSVIA